MDDYNWREITDEESYPSPYDEVLFQMDDGRVYYGCCDTEYDWYYEGDNENTHYVKGGDVVAWKRLSLFVQHQDNEI